MEPRTYIKTLTASAAALASAGRRHLSAPVQGCPGWKVADVVTHVGGVHRWAATAVRTGQRPANFTPPPEGTVGEELVVWGEQGATEIIDALRSADPDADMWTFGPPRTARFWLRRQAHETAVHAWDATDAVGDPLPLDPDMSADGVDEFLDVLLPRWREARPGTWSGETIHIHRTDGDGEWLVRLGAEGATMVERAHGKGDMAVRGPATDLLLWAQNRHADGLEFLGDTRLARRWAEEIAF
jgi:uncharacterized protein (TIGR03083 family)